ncbi:MAG: hypothetical protein Q8N20_07980, partial [Eubacteriales bacterium]|nr:hypothetical protein [Eubacteriales bacterium]
MHEPGHHEGDEGIKSRNKLDRVDSRWWLLTIAGAVSLAFLLGLFAGPALRGEPQARPPLPEARPAPQEERQLTQREVLDWLSAEDNRME